MSGDGIEFQIISEIDGEPISPSGFALQWGSTVVKLTKAGDHRLEVYGQTNVIGPYSFRVATVKVRDIPTTIGLNVNGQLDVPGRIDRYEFDSDGATAIKIIGGNGALPGHRTGTRGRGRTRASRPRASRSRSAATRRPSPSPTATGPTPWSSGRGRPRPADTPSSSPAPSSRLRAIPRRGWSRRPPAPRSSAWPGLRSVRVMSPPTH